MFHPLRIFQFTVYLSCPFIILKMFGTTNAGFMESVTSSWLRSTNSDILEKQLEDQRQANAQAEENKPDDTLDYFKLMEQFKEQKARDLKQMQER
jgi:hypothetical protein